MFNSLGHHMSLPTVAHQRFNFALMAMSLAAIALAVFFPMFADLLPHIPTSGHSHVHAHGHAFIDARSFFGIPNCLDVISVLCGCSVGFVYCLFPAQYSFIENAC